MYQKLDKQKGNDEVLDEVLFNKKSDTIEEQKELLGDEAVSIRDHAADAQNGPESATNNTMNLGPVCTLIEPCKEDSSSRDVILTNKSDQDKDLSENGTIIEPCDEDSVSRNVLLTNMSDKDKNLFENGTLIEPCEKDSSSRDDLRTIMSDQDKDLSENGYFKPK